MIITIKTRVAIETVAGGSSTKVVVFECGGVSVDNDATLVVIDDKEVVIAMLDAADWESFEFVNDAEPAQEDPNKVPASGHVGGEISSCTTYGTGLAL